MATIKDFVKNHGGESLSVCISTPTFYDYSRLMTALQCEGEFKWWFGDKPAESSMWEEHKDQTVIYISCIREYITNDFLARCPDDYVIYSVDEVLNEVGHLSEGITDVESIDTLYEEVN